MKTMTLAILAISSSFASANMILNGDFENNTAGETFYNLSNASFTSLMSDIVGYGSGNELDIMTFGAFGLAPQSGNYKAGMATGLGTDALTFKLASGITAGVAYSLSFWAYRDQSFRSGNGSLNIGVSNSATAPGSQVYSTGVGVPSTAWTKFEVLFVAPVSGGYLSVEAVAGNDIVWYHVDNFNLQVVPEPATMTALTLGVAVAIRRRKSK